MNNLVDKVAVVTGGGDGIGRAIALELAREGASVAILDIDGTTARSTAADVEALSGHGMALACDVARRDQVVGAVKDVVGHWGHLDVLVNNAVWFHYAPLAEVDEETVERMLAVGLTGVIWMIQACTPHLATSRGCIINMSSPAVDISITGAAVYSSVKGGVDALTRQQAGELGPRGVRVNALCPGPIETPGTRRVITEAGWEARRAKIPLRRLTTGAEVGRAAVYLAGDDGASINGATIRLDGGLTVAGP